MMTSRHTIKHEKSWRINLVLNQFLLYTSMACGYPYEWKILKIIPNSIFKILRYTSDRVCKRQMIQLEDYGKFSIIAIEIL